MDSGKTSADEPDIPPPIIESSEPETGQKRSPQEKIQILIAKNEAQKIQYEALNADLERKFNNVVRARDTAEKGWKESQDAAEKLQSEKFEIQNELNALRIENQTAVTKLDECSAQLKEAEEQKVRAVNSLDEIAMKFEAQKKQSMDDENFAKSLKAENHKEHEISQKLRAENSDLLSEKAALERELKPLRQTNELFEAENAALKAELQQLKTTSAQSLQTVKFENSSLVSENSHLKESLENEKEKQRKLEEIIRERDDLLLKEKEEFNKLRVAKAMELDELVREKTSLNTLLETERLRVETAEKEYSDLCTQFREQDKRHRNSLEICNETERQLRETIAAKENELAKLHADFDEFRTHSIQVNHVDNLQLPPENMSPVEMYQKYVTVLDKLRLEREQNLKNQRYIASVQNEIEVRAPIVETFRTKHKKLESVCMELQRENARCSARCDLLKSSLEASSRELKSTSENYANVARENNDLRRQIAYLLNGGSHPNEARFLEANEQYALSVFSNYEELVRKHNECMGKLRDAEERCSDLQRELEMDVRDALVKNSRTYEQKCIDLERKLLEKSSKLELALSHLQIVSEGGVVNQRSQSPQRQITHGASEEIVSGEETMEAPFRDEYEHSHENAQNQKISELNELLQYERQQHSTVIEHMKSVTKDYYTEAGNRLEKLENALTESNTKLIAAETKVGVLNYRIEFLERNVSSSDREKASLTTRVESMEAQKNTLTAQLEMTRGEVKQRVDEIATLRRENEFLMQKVRNHKAKDSVSDSSVMSLNERIEQLKSDRNLLMEKVSDLEKKLISSEDKLRAQSRRSDDEVSSLKKLNADLKEKHSSEIRAIQLEKNNAERVGESRVKELMSKSSEVGQLRQALAAANEDVKARSAELEETKAKLESAAERFGVSSTHEDMLRLTAPMDSSRDSAAMEVSSLRTMVTARQQEIKELKTQQNELLATAVETDKLLQATTKSAQRFKEESDKRVEAKDKRIVELSKKLSDQTKFVKEKAAEVLATEEKYTSMLRALENEKRLAEAKVSSVETEMQSKATYIEQLKEEISRCSTAVNEAENRANSNLIQLASATSELMEARTQRDEARKSLKEISEECSRVQEELATQTEKLGSLTAEHATLKDQLQTVSATAESTEKELRDQVEVLTLTAQEKNGTVSVAEYTKLQSRFREEEMKSKRLSVALEKLEWEFDSTQRSLWSREKEVSMGEQTVAELNQKLTAASAEISELKSGEQVFRMKELEDSLRVTKESNTYLRRDAERCKKDVQKLERMLKSTQESIEPLNKELSMAKVKIGNLERSRIAAVAEAAATRKSLNSLLGNINTIDPAEHEALKAELAETCKMRDEMEAKYEAELRKCGLKILDLEKEVSTSKATVKGMQDTIDEICAENEAAEKDLNKKLAKCKVEIDELKATVASLKQKLEAANELNASLMAENEEIQPPAIIAESEDSAVISDLQAQVSQCELTKKALEETIENLQDELKQAVGNVADLQEKLNRVWAIDYDISLTPQKTETILNMRRKAIKLVEEMNELKKKHADAAEDTAGNAAGDTAGETALHKKRKANSRPQKLRETEDAGAKKARQESDISAPEIRETDDDVEISPPKHSTKGKRGNSQKRT